MNAHNQLEIENLALAIEPARQLGHDFGNFLYTFFLQFEIWETTGTAPKLREWETIKREGKKVADRLQEWRHFNGRFSFVENTIDLHQVIRDCADATIAQGRAGVPPELLLSLHDVTPAMQLQGARANAAALLRFLLETPPGLKGTDWEAAFTELLQKCGP